MVAIMQCITCKSCNKSYMVGFMGKDVRNTKLSGGSLDGTPYVAIGNGELDNNPIIKEGDHIPCPNCGDNCIVEDAKENH